LSSAAQINRNLRDAAFWHREALVESLDDETKMILSRSQQIVPVDTSALKQSGRMLGPQVSPSQIKFRIRYGNQITENYAVRQHEDLTLRHKAGKQAKFLEEPAMQAAGNMALRVANRIKLQIGNRDFFR
jgi:hypothetical protein